MCLKLVGWIVVLSCNSLCGLGIVGCKTVTADSMVQRVSVSDLQAKLAGDEGILLLDIRREIESDTALIPGALHMPYSEIRANDPQIAQAKQVVVYGQGAETRAYAAAERIVELYSQAVKGWKYGEHYWGQKPKSGVIGYRDVKPVYVLLGGADRWFADTAVVGD